MAKSLVLCSILFLVAAPIVIAQQRVAKGTLPPPRFDDPERARKLATAFPEIEKLFNSFVERTHMPGAVLGIQFVQRDFRPRCYFAHRKRFACNRFHSRIKLVIRGRLRLVLTF